MKHVDLLWVQLRTSPQQCAVAKGFYSLLNAFLPVWRIKRDFNRIKTRLQQHGNMLIHFLRADASQNSNQRDVSGPLHQRFSSYLIEMRDRRPALASASRPNPVPDRSA